MVADVIFPCGSKGHPEYCPSQCSCGRFCKFLKNKTPSVKPREVVPKIDDLKKNMKKKEEPEGKVEFYY